MDTATAYTRHNATRCWTRLAATAWDPATTRRPARRGAPPRDSLAREHAGGYDPHSHSQGDGDGEGDGRDEADHEAHDPDPSHDPDPAHDSAQADDSDPAYDSDLDEDLGPGEGVRAAVTAARQAVERVLALATDDQTVDGGQLGAVLELLAGIDTAQAAAIELAATVQTRGLSERSAALPLDGLLAFPSRATYGDRRTLCNLAEQLATLPHLRAAFHAGAVGFAQVRAIVAEARRLTAGQRAGLDAGFVDHDRLARLEPDRLLDAVADHVAAARSDLERDRARRVIEHRYLALQPALDGSGTGYFELDAPAYATVAEAIDAALAPLSAGPNDISRDAPGETHPDGYDSNGHGGPDGDGEGTTSGSGPDGDGEDATPDGEPGFCDPLERRDRGRVRADALVRLSETFLAGPTGTGPAGATTAGEVADAATCTAARPATRARPSVQAVCDIAQLTGHDQAAIAARALVATIGATLRLTPAGVRRLACDAKLQAVLTHHGQILGTTDPTDRIPTAVRRALTARDQGCRFPGCTVPVHWTDAHHIRHRHHGGPTTLENLALLCRRHHTAVHEGGWHLTMTPNATITVRRGQRRATTDPPLRRALPPPAP